MKIKIISIHDIGINFGSTLQACALYDFIRGAGYSDVSVINYKPEYAYNHGRLGQLIKKLLFYKDVKIQTKKFKKYYSEHCNLTKEYKKNTELIAEAEADVFIVGSDQVWNEYYDGGRDSAYYLEFTKCKNKMSYAASVGQEQSYEAIERLVNRISDFTHVSVREHASMIQLRNAGMERVEHVLDPIFLHDKEYYVDPSFVNKYGKYILVYVVHSDSFMNEMVAKIAEKFDAKIVLVGGYIQKMHHDFYLRDIGPKEFVNLINNAEFVVANSFHATAFSILLSKQFALVNPKVSPLRLKDMLEVANIQGRIITCEEDLNLAMSKIDYDCVNRVIKSEQQRSREYLLHCLESFSHKGEL